MADTKAKKKKKDEKPLAPKSTGKTRAKKKEPKPSKSDLGVSSDEGAVDTKKDISESSGKCNVE